MNFQNMWRVFSLILFSGMLSGCLTTADGHMTTFYGVEPIGTYTLPSISSLASIPTDGSPGSKSAMGCVNRVDAFILPIVWGDASISTIAEKSGITKVKFVSFKNKRDSFITARYCVVVQGD
jgi:hypothetical protein